MIELVVETTKSYQFKVLSLVSICLLTLSFADFTTAQNMPDQAAGAGKGNSSIQVDTENALVTLDVHDVPLVDILQEIAQKTELIVYMHDLLNERITLQVENVSLPEVLVKVLRNYSFALHYVEPVRNPESIHPESMSRLWVYADIDVAGSSVSPVVIVRSTKQELRTNLEQDDLKSVAHDRDKKVSKLSVMLLHENKDVRLDAIAMLAEMDDADSLTLLAFALSDQDSVVREQTVDALLTVEGADTVHLFEQAINDIDAAVRAAAVSALGEVGGAESVRVLGLALHNQDPKTREETIYALGDLNDDSATRLIEFGLKDTHPSVRLTAIETLASTGNRRSVAALAMALNDKSTLVREEVIHALGEFGGDDAVALLERATADKDETIATLAREVLDLYRTNNNSSELKPHRPVVVFLPHE